MSDIVAVRKLHEAARRCDTRAVEEIVKAGKTNLDATDQRGCTAVHLCSQLDDPTPLAVLLENDAKTDIYDSSGMVALHHAAIKGNVEAIGLLIAYGADVNKPNKKTNMTALHYANNNKHKRSVDLFLFCGADFSLKDRNGAEALSGMSRTERAEHKFVQDGFETGHIRFSGRMLRPRCWVEFKSLDMSVVNNDSNNHSICFFCRRDALNYVRITAGEGEEIISDVFQYHISQPSDNLTVALPGSSFNEQFDEVFVKDHTGKRYSCAPNFDEESQETKTATRAQMCSKISEIECFTWELAALEQDSHKATIDVNAKNDGQGYFMVVVVGKEENFTASGEHQIIQSSVEKGFGIEAPDESLMPDSPIIFKVLPTKDYITEQKDYITEQTTRDVETVADSCGFGPTSQQRLSTRTLLNPPPRIAHRSEVQPTHDPISAQTTRDVECASNLYEVHLSSRRGPPIKLTLPLPTSLPLGSDVMVYHAKENQTEEDSWNIINWQREKGTQQVTVADPSIEGSAIVLGVPKKKSKDFGHRIKKFLAWLYDTVTKRIKPYVFSVLTKSSDGLKFRVLILLEEERAIENSVKKFQGENFQTQLAQKSGPIMVKPNETFLLKLDGDDVKVQGLSLFVISAQPKRISQHEFLVLSKQFNLVQLLIYKWKADQKFEMREPQRELCSVQINIELLMEATEGAGQPFTEFPDSTFLNKLADDIGDEWFLLGVCLGLKPSFLEAIQRGFKSPTETNRTILYTWRANNDREDDLGVTKLIHALKITGREDLVMLLNNFISATVKEKPMERITKWSKMLLSDFHDERFHFDRSRFDKLVNKFDPNTDQFLVQVSMIIGPRFEIPPELGIRKEEVDDMRNTLSQHTVMLKCLIQCRRKHGNDPIKFLDELFKALTFTRNNQAAMDILELLEDWLDLSASERDSELSSSIEAFCENFYHH